MDKTDLEIEWRPIEGLTPFHNNPKTHPVEQVDKIASSIAEYGFNVPLVVNSEGVVLSGHGRLEAAKRLRLKRVPVIVKQDLSKLQQKGYRIADNKSAESPWLDEALRIELAELQEQDFDLELTGFDTEEIDALLSGLDSETDTSGLEGDDEAADNTPEISEVEIRCQVGDIFELAGHRIMCGDCRNTDHVQTLMDGKKINVCMTSPPYASQRKYDEYSEFKPIRPNDYVNWFESVQANIKQHLAQDGSFFLNIKEHCEDGQRHLYVKDLTIAHVRQWGWRFVDEFCWKRPGVPGGWNNRFKNSWEPVFHFCVNLSIKHRAGNVTHETEHAFDYSPLNGKSISGSGLLGKEHGERFRSGMARPGNVIETATGGAVSTGEHEASYPAALPEFFIKAFSDEGDRVYDPFAGSGTTGVGAHKNNRVAYLMEISPRYTSLILMRLERFTGQKAQQFALGGGG